MPSTAELRKRLQGIRATRQITNAMKMVAAARFAAAQRRALGAAALPEGLGALVRGVRARLEAAAEPSASPAPAPAPDRPVGLLVVASDKGLCADFNSSVLRAARALAAPRPGRVGRLLIVGQRAFALGRDLPAGASRTFRMAAGGYELAAALAQEVLRAAGEGLSGFHAVYHPWQHGSASGPSVCPLLPIPPSRDGAALALAALEPDDPEQLLAELVPRWLAARIHQILAESLAAELSARMLAMDNATRNADTMIGQTTHEVNQARQAAITRELVEILGAQEAAGGA